VRLGLVRLQDPKALLATGDALGEAVSLVTTAIHGEPLSGRFIARRTADQYTEHNQSAS
jgi:hypothetical protein